MSVHDDRFLQGTLIGIQNQIEGLAAAIIGQPDHTKLKEFSIHLREVHKRLGLYVPEHEPLGKELFHYAQARENERLRRR